MLKFRENEEAVSPVIGVILMVAITVILAAVIAAFVFGMGSNVSTQKMVPVTASLNSSQNLIVTVQGGGDVGMLKNLTMTINNKPSGDTPDNISVGDSLSSNRTISAGDHVVVVAYFKDNTEQVVLDKFY
ncbi:type IV pilin N-terminal domain-containing protein [Methanoculleus sp. UBA413]|jgi:flagellin-like protein|uniref:type IV pilin N-terminal domain-containing protein n=1 Tax=Methanoculleus sp. UBA413 TaxID=1915509 RepID=UPI00257B0140|nr:type IV pilin N-terminal domain-containing protein [Methanoculleus sp. UBA413]